MSSFPNRIVARAKQFVGVKEQPPGTNRGPYLPKLKGGIDDWCRRANGQVGYPWCSAFACAMSEDSGYRIPDPRRASVGFLEAWAASVGTAGDDANGGQVQIRYRWCSGRERFIRLVPRSGDV
jgi:hypothetical protein